MPYFVVLAPDRTGALPERTALREQHLEYWATAATSVKVAGAMLKDDVPCGSCFLVEAADEAAVRALLAEDPFTRGGVFAERPSIVQVRPAIGDWLPPS